MTTERLSLDKSKIKFLFLENIHQNAIDALARAGYTNVTTYKTALDGDVLAEALQDVHFLGIRSRTQVTADIIARAPKLTAIGCFCIGTNQVATEEAEARGIPVFNAPFSNTRSVAELVIAETVILMRGILEKNAIVHRGGWVKSAEGSFEVRGKTLGIIGYGNIGTQLGVLAEHMGMRVVFHDVEAKLPLGNARQAPTLDALLTESDVVTLHVPETPETTNMIGAEQLAKMKQGAHLINASRGMVVDIEALAAALASKHIGGTAIDVFPVEPGSNTEEFLSPLRVFDNALLTPHIGGSTMEAQANIGIEVGDKLVRYSDNGSTATAVNFPDVVLPAHPGRSRLLHIHRNQPGVLAQINERFSRRGINISSQFLQTTPRIGYCVMDVDVEASAVALEELQTIPGTLRCRLLY
ncbi:phosphoglycerate dehydrogenase [soil metagenome]